MVPCNRKDAVVEVAANSGTDARSTVAPPQRSIAEAVDAKEQVA
jgi:hypothetical protein